MTADYALRGTLGANYSIDDDTTIGGYYQTEEVFRFDNAFLLNPGPAQNAFDVQMDLPQNLGIGIANHTLMDGCLLIGVDVIYKLWNEAALFDAIYDNQLVVQIGTQYTRGRLRLRAGYAWAENPIDDTPGMSVGGVQPGDLRAVRYTQALLAVTSQNRISAGIGVVDVLPGMDIDLVAGGMLQDSQQLGDATTTSIESYWIGTAVTWRFGRGSSEDLGIPDDWSSSG
jgi:long-chain fatty acid transport protein